MPSTTTPPPINIAPPKPIVNHPIIAPVAIVWTVAKTVPTAAPPVARVQL